MAGEQPETHVTLALKHEGEAINGRIESERGELRSFWGWLELMAALDGLRNRPEDEEPADTVAP